MSDDGGPAFPTAWPNAPPDEGMRLRDWFAGRALDALIAKVPLHLRLGEHGISSPTIEEIHGVRCDSARSAYDYADAMIAEKRRRKANER